MFGTAVALYTDKSPWPTGLFLERDDQSLLKKSVGSVDEKEHSGFFFYQQVSV